MKDVPRKGFRFLLEVAFEELSPLNKNYTLVKLRLGSWYTVAFVCCYELFPHSLLPVMQILI